MLNFQSSALRIHPIKLMMPVTIASSFAFMLPVATPPNAMVYEHSDMTISYMVFKKLILHLNSIYNYIRLHDICNDRHTRKGMIDRYLAHILVNFTTFLKLALNTWFVLKLSIVGIFVSWWSWSRMCQFVALYPVILPGDWLTGALRNRDEPRVYLHRVGGNSYSRQLDLRSGPFPPMGRKRRAFCPWLMIVLTVTSA